MNTLAEILEEQMCDVARKAQIDYVAVNHPYGTRKGQSPQQLGDFIKVNVDEAINKIEALIKEAKPKDYLDCEKYPLSSSRCNNCFGCKHDNNQDFEDGMNYGIDTYEANLHKKLKGEV